jgi:N-acetylglucosaminyl-diphospho-decaprenol L-rhamnosyltransferase
VALTPEERSRGLSLLRPEDRTAAREGGKTAIRGITLIVVSWKDQEDLAGCLESLSAARGRAGTGGPEISLVVVDNGGHLREPGSIRSLWPGARWIVNDTNRGLGPAANQAAAAATGDILLFMNPDTRAEGEPYSEIARAFEERPEVVAVAPRLIDTGAPSNGAPARLAPPDREDQFTFQLRRLPTLGSDARQLLLFDHLFPNNAGRRRDRYADVNRDAPLAVEQAAGAAFAVRKSAFVASGGFDEQFTPAWFEDVDLCDRLARHGGTILYWPAARFRHAGGASSRKLGYDRFLPIYYENALRYRRRYSPPARLIYRVLLGAGMALRLAALPFRPNLPRSRAEAARAYFRTLAVALGHLPRSCQLS